MTAYIHCVLFHAVAGLKQLRSCSHQGAGMVCILLLGHACGSEPRGREAQVTYYYGITSVRSRTLTSRKARFCTVVVVHFSCSGVELT